MSAVTPVTRDPTCDVLIAGGGTAGHTNPGIAIAQALVRAGMDPNRIRFAGSRRGNESSLVPQAGFQIDLLSGRGIPRSLSPAALKAGLETARGVVQASSLVRRRKPKVVVCLGGYAAFGPSLAALMFRTAVVVSEQNARASAVNRHIGRFAKACALPFPGTDLPNGVVTGNPIRSEVVAAVREADAVSSRITLELPPALPVVAAWSGSLGATKLNQTVRQLAIGWADRDDVSLYHVVGDRDWEHFGPIPPEVENGVLKYRTVRYEHQMPLLLTAASIAVARAGASTVAELAVAGLPAVLIPLPGAPRDHQRANAEQLANAGGAAVLDQSDLTCDSLDRALDAWLSHPEARKAASHNLETVAFPEAAQSVAELVMRAGGLEHG